MIANFCPARGGKRQQILKVFPAPDMEQEVAATPLAFMHSEAGQAPVSALPSDPRQRQYQSVSGAILPPRIGQIQI